MSDAPARTLSSRSAGAGIRITPPDGEALPSSGEKRSGPVLAMSRQRSLTLAVVLGVLAIAAGIILSYAIHSFPPAASTQAHRTDTLYHVLVIACVPIFVLVT